jgi:hypothetical protein
MVVATVPYSSTQGRGGVEGYRYFFSCGSGGRDRNTYIYLPRCIDITVTRLADSGVETIGAVGIEAGGDDDLECK